METWFSLSGMRVQPPPKWKMFTVTLLAAYTVSLISRLLLGPYLGDWPLFASNLIFTVILVATLTYFRDAPTRLLFRKWLYQEQR